MYKKIMVTMALDHDVSSHTIQAARALRGPDGEIIALHVYEAPQGSVSAFLDQEVVHEGFEKARELMRSKLVGMTDVRADIVKGHSSRTIIDYAVDNGIDCIVVASHKPDLSNYFLGSTASRVVRHAPCAVHVHR